MAAFQVENEIIDEEDVSFAGALPKSEIQATEFLQQHPEYDGRGTVIAIFDTGVDPGAFGLQRTTDGKPKIIDVVDCTGSGDVDTSKKVTADADGALASLYGNKLLTNPAWVNPSGEWRVGARPAFDFFPAGLRSRMKEERKRRWDEKQRAAVTRAAAAVAAFSKANGAAPPVDDGLKKQREEVEGRVKLLAEMAEKYEDLGPMVECVVWHDGERWLAALDTSDFFEPGSGRGALADFKPLTNYRDCLRHGTFSAEDACNFAVNIYDEGATLSIVVDAGPHGTHVAGIAAAHHPEDRQLNGVAPGAQIVSCKIGDSRLGSMETMVGLTRALITVLQNKADLINMSYGEATATPNAGRFIRLAEEIVHKHGVIFVASAGNAGPALTTVGAPGGTSSAVLGVGAFVTPALAAAGHSLRGELDVGQQYTWSSRGPTPDGDTGVTFSAPGGAIAAVPQWTTQLRQLMNGTSMSSPCACGGLALVVSALKAEGQAVTPARVRRAVENTALAVNAGQPDSVLTYGRGLLQVAAAYEYLHRAAADGVDSPPDLRLDVTARRSDASEGARGRGIYMREPAEALHAVTYQVEVKPGLKECADVLLERLAIDLKLTLKSTAPWVKAPSLLVLHHGGRSFEVEVDPTSLPEGLHYAEVQGFDSAAEWRGPLFRLPVTVIRPLILAAQPGLLTLAETSGGGGGSTGTAVLEAGTLLRLGTLQFDPGKEERRFVAVPEGASWADLRLRATDNDTPKGFMLRATHILPHTRYSDSELRSYVQLPPHGDHLASLAVTPGATLELTIAQFWSSLGGVSLDVELAIHGVQIESSCPSGGGGGVVVDGAAGVAKIFARAPLRRERIKPVAKLDTLRIPLRPAADADLAPLGAPRDELPGGRTLHRLILTYRLTLLEGGKVTPRLPQLNRFVYDGEVEAQMYFIADDNRQTLGMGDIYPEAVALKKGDYTIRLLLRHEDPAFLERLRHLALLVERKLETEIKVGVYGSNGDALRGTNALFKERVLCPGERVALFVGNAPEDKLPKDATAGRQLVGTLSLGLTAANGKEAPGASVLTYTVPPKKAEPISAAAVAADSAAVEAKPTAEAALAEALRDAEVKFLQEMKLSEGSDEGRAAYDRLLSDLLSRFPGHLPLLREPLQRLSSKAKGERDAATLRAVVAAADGVLVAVDGTELAVFLAQKCPEEGAGAAKRKKEMDERKGAVVEALAAKCAALLDLEEGAEGGASTAAAAGGSGDGGEAFDAAFKELRRWVDPAADAAHAVLLARREARAGRLAGALKALDKAANPEDKPASREVLEQRKLLLERLGWGHWARAEAARIKKAFPPALPPF